MRLRPGRHDGRDGDQVDAGFERRLCGGSGRQDTDKRDQSTAAEMMRHRIDYRRPGPIGTRDSTLRTSSARPVPAVPRPAVGPDVHAQAETRLSVVVIRAFTAGADERPGNQDRFAERERRLERNGHGENRLPGARRVKEPLPSRDHAAVVSSDSSRSDTGRQSADRLDIHSPSPACPASRACEPAAVRENVASLVASESDGSSRVAPIGNRKILR